MSVCVHVCRHVFTRTYTGSLLCPGTRRQELTTTCSFIKGSFVPFWMGAFSSLKYITELHLLVPGFLKKKKNPQRKTILIFQHINKISFGSEIPLKPNPKSRLASSRQSLEWLTVRLVYSKQRASDCVSALKIYCCHNGCPSRAIKMKHLFGKTLLSLFSLLRLPQLWFWVCVVLYCPFMYLFVFLVCGLQQASSWLCA